MYFIDKAADCLLPLLALRELIALKAMKLVVSLCHALELLPTVFRVYSEQRTFEHSLSYYMLCSYTCAMSAVSSKPLVQWSKRCFHVFVFDFRAASLVYQLWNLPWPIQPHWLTYYKCWLTNGNPSHSSVCYQADDQHDRWSYTIGLNMMLRPLFVKWIKC